MIIVNIHEAKTHFSTLLNQALNGEEVIIARGGKPIIRLSPYTEKEIPSRKGGQLKGLLHIAEDFDAPLPPDILNAFYSNQDDPEK